MIEHNGRVCESLERQYEAMSWNILKSLYGFDFPEVDEPEAEASHPVVRLKGSESLNRS